MVHGGVACDVAGQWQWRFAQVWTIFAPGGANGIYSFRGSGGAAYSSGGSSSCKGVMAGSVVALRGVAALTLVGLAP
ncbi:MAG: hypothetical protein U0271_45390 [Polyangiaceae bacterium]